MEEQKVRVNASNSCNRELLTYLLIAMLHHHTIVQAYVTEHNDL